MLKAAQKSVVLSTVFLASISAASAESPNDFSEAALNKLFDQTDTKKEQTKPPATKGDGLFGALGAQGNPLDTGTRGFNVLPNEKGKQSPVKSTKYQSGTSPALADTTSSAHPAKDLPILFELGSASITSGSQQKLDQLAIWLERGKLQNYNFTIEGHTDSRGTPEQNMALSEARANAVRQYLIDHGVDASRLEAVGKGQTEPAVPNDLLAAENRRVILVKAASN